MNYKELEKKPAIDYLDPENFKTGFDKNDEHAENQYKKGLEIGSEMGYILISDRSVWLAGDSSKTGVISSSEGIGYHKNTKDLLRGFIDSGATIVVNRLQEDYSVKSVQIQEGDSELKENVQNNIREILNKKGIKSVLLKPLASKPLMSQISQTPLYDLKFDEENMAYVDNKNTHYILSNFDIARHNLQNEIKQSKKIEDAASIVFVENKDNINYTSEKIELKTKNKRLELFVKPKQVESDNQQIYCIIKRDKKNKARKNKIKPS